MIVEATPAQATRHLVLLVDDLPANLQVMVAGLKSQFRLKTATSGPSALALLAREAELPQLILLDVKMPGMNGIEVLRCLRSEPHTRDIPVILFSADNSEQNEIAGLQSGADDYLIKPISPTVLSVKASNLIQRNADRVQLRLAAHVFEYSGEAIMITDRDNRIIDVNAAFTSQTGYDKADVLGRDPRLLSSGRVPFDFYREMWESIQTQGFWRGELWDRRKDGSTYPKVMTISVVRDRQGAIEFHLANFVDVSHYKESQKRIEHLAYHDALTGLPNRLHLQVYLEQTLLIARRMGEQVAVMLLDLDRFKLVNDTLGHHVGDELLIQTAHRLTACVREYDMVVRLGGDEFVVVLRGSGMQAAATATATKICQQVGRPLQIGAHALRTSPSIGIVLYPDDAVLMDDLIKQADTAMYVTKAEGGNGFRFFSSEMTERFHTMLEMENQLHDALEQAQFELYFQPQFSLPGLEVVGFEVLLRWNHPEKGLISPAVFIPVAESTNQIVAIGEWVLRRACQQASDWLRSGLALGRVAVNVSARQFQHTHLAELVRTVLAETGLPAHCLELELTETAVTSSPEATALTLQLLRESGVQVALDDFGMGYSSLGQLKGMPLDRLKIDATFVRDITGEPGSKGGAIAAATIVLGHNLGFAVIAEGVETAAQRAFLQAHGCDEVQGYCFARPMPRAEFEAFVRGWTPPLTDN